MAVQWWQKSRRIYVIRGRVRSPHISGGRRWISCRQPACLLARQLCHGTDTLTDCAIPKCPGRSIKTMMCSCYASTARGIMLSTCLSICACVPGQRHSLTNLSSTSSFCVSLIVRFVDYTVEKMPFLCTSWNNLFFGGWIFRCQWQHGEKFWEHYKNVVILLLPFTEINLRNFILSFIP